MSNSPLVSYTRYNPNHSSRRTHAIDTVTIHCMAGNMSVESCGALFANPETEASSNYGIGSDGRIALYVDEANRSWCSSNAKNDNRAVTIEVANIPAFRKKMNKYVREHTGCARPVSSLAIDAELTRPSLVTLDEVERLSELEPYGAGNDRPVFCLRGALLEAVQSVGQNRHLKVRLQKGHTSFEGIFFSVTAEDVGLAPGSRVDAAFYLQINEFRGSRSVQLQLLDLRAARAPSAHESELLALRDALLSGEPITPRDAVRLLPSREQFVRAWRTLEHEAGGGPVSRPELPLLRRIAGELGGAESFLRAALCLEIFAERGLLALERAGDTLTLRLTSQGKKVELDDNPYVSRLRGILSQGRR